MNLKKTNKELIFFNKSEVVSIILVAFLFAFALTFRMWGDDYFDFVTGLMNLSLVYFGMLITIFVHELGHKLVGAREGYEVLIKKNTSGLLISVFITIYSMGLIPFITPNFLLTDARPDKRIGKYYKYDNPRQNTYIVLGGVLASLFMIATYNLIYLITNIEIIRVIMLGSFLHLLYGLIPFELLSFVTLRLTSKIPKGDPGDGLHLIWDNFYLWLGVLLTVVTYGLLSFTYGYVSVFFACLLAITITYVIKKIQ